MNGSRESEITRAFVSLTSALANGADPPEMLHELTITCLDLLNVQAAGLVLADRQGILHVLAASSEEIMLLEVFQLQRQQGPCLDCYREGTPISSPDLAQEGQRWPQFAPAAVAAGFASVNAVPMRLRSHTLGAMGLFDSSPGLLSADDLALGRALADVASVALMQEETSSEQVRVNDQLQKALTSRVVLEQAKGILAQSGGLNMPTAFEVLRRHARNHNERLSAVAAALVSRELAVEQVLAGTPRSQAPAP